MAQMVVTLASGTIGKVTGCDVRTDGAYLSP
jgi:hypothetical protein